MHNKKVKSLRAILSEISQISCPELQSFEVANIDAVFWKRTKVIAVAAILRCSSAYFWHRFYGDIHHGKSFLTRHALLALAHLKKHSNFSFALKTYIDRSSQYCWLTRIFRVWSAGIFRDREAISTKKVTLGCLCLVPAQKLRKCILKIRLPAVRSGAD